MDFRHHATDVLFGALVGTLVSYFCYRQYFPTLNSPHSHLPFAPRFPEVEKPGTNHEAGIPMTNQAGSPDLEGGGTMGRRRRTGEDTDVAENHIDGTAPRAQRQSLEAMWAGSKAPPPATATTHV